MTIFIFVLTRLIRNAIISGIISLTGGSIIGLLVGAIRRRMQETLYVARVGAFVGGLCACISPLGSQPGTLESWGDGGGLGSLVVIATIMAITLISLLSALLASTVGFQAILKLSTKWLVWGVFGLFGVMVFSLYQGYVVYCFSGSSFCS